jgi:hypothetical protein
MVRKVKQINAMPDRNSGDAQGDPWPIWETIIIGGIGPEQIACCPSEAEADRRRAAGEVVLGPAELAALARVNRILGGRVEAIRKVKP